MRLAQIRLTFATGLLCQKLYKEGIFPSLPDQAIVNEYIPGQGISAHIDCVPCFADTIASLSFGSPCIMEFFNPKTGEKKSIVLEECSLIVLSGSARYECQHAIPARKSDIINGAKIERGRRVSVLAFPYFNSNHLLPLFKGFLCLCGYGMSPHLSIWIAPNEQASVRL